MTEEQRKTLVEAAEAAGFEFGELHLVCPQCRVPVVYDQAEVWVPGGYFETQCKNGHLIMGELHVIVLVQAAYYEAPFEDDDE